MQWSNNSKTDVGALIADLEQADKSIVRAAVNVLASLAKDSAELRAQLQRKMAEPQVQNHWAITYVLAQLPEPSRDVVQRLLDSLDHNDADIRWAIGLLLVRLAGSDEEIMRELMRLCTMGNALQRRMAIYCLSDLNPQDAESTEVFLLALRDPDPRVRMAAATGLKRKNLDLPGKDALLAVFLKDPDDRVKSVAAVTLAQIGAPSGRFLRALNLAEFSANEPLAKAVRAALSLVKK